MKSSKFIALLVLVASCGGGGGGGDASVPFAITLAPNSISVDEDKITMKKKINIGMATALSDGNLIVPVIKNADQLNLVGMAKTVNDLANRARKNSLKPVSYTHLTLPTNREV